MIPKQDQSFAVRGVAFSRRGHREKPDDCKQTASRWGHTHGHRSARRPAPSEHTGGCTHSATPGTGTDTSPHLGLPHPAPRGSPRTRAHTLSSSASALCRIPSPSISLPALTPIPHIGPLSEEAPDSLSSFPRSLPLTPAPCPWPHLSSRLHRSQILLAHPSLRPYRKLASNICSMLSMGQALCPSTCCLEGTQPPPATPTAPLPSMPGTPAVALQQDGCPHPAQPASLGRVAWCSGNSTALCPGRIRTTTEQLHDLTQVTQCP